MEHINYYTEDPMFWKDREWGDRFIPEIKRILAKVLFSIDDEEDRKHNSDFWIPATNGDGKAIRISMHIRHYEENTQDEWLNEYSVRYWQNGGGETEYAKIMSGYGDYMIYAWADGDNLVTWLIVDLGKFREFAEQIEATGNPETEWQRRGCQIRQTGVSGDSALYVPKYLIPGAVFADSVNYVRVKATEFDWVKYSADMGRKENMPRCEIVMPEDTEPREQHGGYTLLS